MPPVMDVWLTSVARACQLAQLGWLQQRPARDREAFGPHHCSRGICFPLRAKGRQGARAGQGGCTVGAHLHLLHETLPPKEARLQLRSWSISLKSLRWEQIVDFCGAAAWLDKVGERLALIVVVVLEDKLLGFADQPPKKKGVLLCSGGRPAAGRLFKGAGYLVSGWEPWLQLNGYKSPKLVITMISNHLLSTLPTLPL